MATRKLEQFQVRREFVFLCQDRLTFVLQTVSVAILSAEIRPSAVASATIAPVLAFALCTKQVDNVLKQQTWL